MGLPHLPVPSSFVAAWGWEGVWRDILYHVSRPHVLRDDSLSSLSAVQLSVNIILDNWTVMCAFT